MSKMIPYADAKPIFDKILSIDLEYIPVVSTERLYQKEFAQAVRTLLRSMGITSRQVSVKSATGSMCYWINVEVPHIDRGFTYNDVMRMSESDRDAFLARGKELDNHRYEACRHLDKVIARAFPGCLDRSDPMTDYFDFMYTVH